MLEEYIGNLHKLWQEKKECGMNDTQKSETVTVETRSDIFPGKLPPLPFLNRSRN